MSGAMSLAMMPVGCQVARSKQRAKGGKPETRVDENPKQKPRRTNEGRCLLEKRRTSRAFGGQKKKKKKKELKEEAQERGKARGLQTRGSFGWGFRVAR